MSTTARTSISAAPASAPRKAVAVRHPWTLGFDGTMFGIAAVLAGFGLLMILSASSLGADATFGDAFHYVTRQVVGLCLGAGCALVILRTPWTWIRRGSWPVYLFTLALLIAVMSPLGHSAKGATRWIALGPINLQPSELSKIALIVILADFLANNRGRLKDFVGVVLPGAGLLAPLALLVIFQKDFGTTVILLGLTGVLFFVAGLQWRYVFAGVGGAAGLLALLVLIEPYRIRRLVSFVDPFADPDGAGYQVVQGWIALATGGAFGTGLASGVAQRGFLPEPHTDFISAVIGEELGAIGFCLVIALQIGLVWRAATIARRAPDLYGLLIAIGIGAMFGAQALINLGVVGGMMPAKGLVLPFLSYGASAAVVHTACVGLLIRVGMEGARERASAPVAKES
ncbi:MAG: putative lipid II flippase FtsW [Alphaproteobacteria bacterium]|nr:putative lipid II flippase FtsW [Alphaproteobacteria bacterium]MCB9696933.1 putative lipid II flippase FtsW [Alphaproteobacteria bacterium]